MDIKLILFDYGGVIAPEGFQLGVLKLAQEFNVNFEKMYEIAGYEAGLKLGFTAGQNDERAYWNHVAKLLNTDQDLMNYRYVYLDNFQPRDGMIEIIKQVRKYYDLGIFSDQTNWIYELNDKYGFFKYFKYKFISFDLGTTKHEMNLYSIPTKRTGIKPENILLIDDKQKVIDRATEAGLKGYRFTSIEKCTKYLNQLLEVKHA